MDYSILFILVTIVCLCNRNEVCEAYEDDVPFGEIYDVAWGGDHLTVLEEGKLVQLRLDQFSGAGFISKQTYRSGYFRMLLKIPSRNSEGIVTTFYLTSVAPGQPQGRHDELDFEILGGNGLPYTLSTNVFANDSGNREQQFKLWFDPTKDFHAYDILWNQNQIVFLVDQMPIRVLKYNTKLEINYPSHPMCVQTSLWNGTSWLGMVDWSQGPFIASYRGFHIYGCPSHDNPDPQDCASPIFAWNSGMFWQLTPQQEKMMESVRKLYLTYDYCAEHAEDFPECQIND